MRWHVITHIHLTSASSALGPTPIAFPCRRGGRGHRRPAGVFHYAGGQGERAGALAGGGALAHLAGGLARAGYRGAHGGRGRVLRAPQAPVRAPRGVAAARGTGRLWRGRRPAVAAQPLRRRQRVARRVAHGPCCRGGTGWHRARGAPHGANWRVGAARHVHEGGRRGDGGVRGGGGRGGRRQRRRRRRDAAVAAHGGARAPRHLCAVQPHVQGRVHRAAGVRVVGRQGGVCVRLAV